MGQRAVLIRGASKANRGRIFSPTTMPHGELLVPRGDSAPWLPETRTNQRRPTASNEEIIERFSIGNKPMQTLRCSEVLLLSAGTPPPATPVQSTLLPSYTYFQLPQELMKFLSLPFLHPLPVPRISHPWFMCLLS